MAEPSVDRCSRTSSFSSLTIKGSDSTIHRQAASYRYTPRQNRRGILGRFAMPDSLTAAGVPIGSPVPRVLRGQCARREATRTDVWWRTNFLIRVQRAPELAACPAAQLRLEHLSRITRSQSA